MNFFNKKNQKLITAVIKQPKTGSGLTFFSHSVATYSSLILPCLMTTIATLAPPFKSS